MKAASITPGHLPIPSAAADWITALLQQIEDRAYQGARRALEEQRPPKMGSEELGRLLGKSPGALRIWLLRNPDFPREKAGTRLLFDRQAVDDYLRRRAG